MAFPQKSKSMEFSMSLKLNWQLFSFTVSPISIIFAVIIDNTPTDIYLFFKIVIDEANGREGAFVLKDGNYGSLPAKSMKLLKSANKSKRLFKVDPQYDTFFIYIEPDDFLKFICQPEKKTFKNFFGSKNSN